MNRPPLLFLGSHLLALVPPAVPQRTPPVSGHRHRLVAVEPVRMLRGDWPVTETSALYWLPGGQIGNARTPTWEQNTGRAGLPEPRPAMLAVAAVWAGTDVDESDGVLWVNVAQLFPVDATGRVATWDPAERVTLDTLERALPSP